MSAILEKSRSPWMEALRAPFPPLPRHAEADVVVIGAGISGLTTAYILARAGKKVIVLDAGPPGGGMTARTTGHLATALDGRWFNLIARRGLKAARIAATSHAAAIDFIAQTVSDERIACDFRRLDGLLLLGHGDGKKILNRELIAANRVGLAVDWSDHNPFPGLHGSPCLRFPDQARFHAIKYLNGLIASILRHGGRTYRALVTDVKGGKKAVVKAKAKTVTARAAVVATNSPINGKAIHGQQVPYRTYVTAGYVPRGSVPDVLAWDTIDPYHYTRLHPHDDKRDLVIIGGEDHKTGEATDMLARLGKLEAWGRARFPALADFAFRWSGQVMETIDDLGLLGRNPGDPSNVFIATGDSGMGLTHGTLGGLTIAETILERPSPWTTIYDPARKKPRTSDPHVAKTPATDAMETMQPLTDGSQLARGTGALITRGRAKIAAFRRASGQRIERSAKCTHAGCTVAWNSFEECWDCACHGSHFATNGAVLNAPAVEELKPAARARK